MEGNKKNSDIQLEINNLIDNAVNNAVARRNPDQDSEDVLLTLSDEEMAKVAGGFATVLTSVLLKKPLIVGLIALPQLDLKTQLF